MLIFVLSLRWQVTVRLDINLGIGSTVIDDIRIGNRVTVGAGAVVVSNISDNIVAIGVPAKKMLVDK